jgi:hypothetical protein
MLKSVDCQLQAALSIINIIHILMHSMVAKHITPPNNFYANRFKKKLLVYTSAAVGFLLSYLTPQLHR